jgi:hypothetical protein
MRYVPDNGTRPVKVPASSAFSTTVLWKYRVNYLDGDQVFGRWSDVGTIAVTG